MSHIEWTDETWNPLVGCTIVSPGCTNCYAMKMAGRIEAIAGAFELEHGTPGPHAHYVGTTKPSNAGSVWTGQVHEAPPSIVEKPLRWKRPRRIFVNSMSDLFHEEVPTNLIDRVFAVIAACPQHTFQILTKRPARALEYAIQATACGEHWLAHVERSHAPMWPLDNVWLGVSAEDQKRADERVPILLQTPAVVRWISAEPLLGPINLRPWVGWIGGDPDTGGFETCFHHPVPRVDWVVAGGESGPGSRPMHPDWPRALRDQCAVANVPFLFKQWGNWAPAPPDVLGTMAMVHEFAGGVRLGHFGKKVAGRDLDGRFHNEYPMGARA